MSLKGWVIPSKLKVNAIDVSKEPVKNENTPKPNLLPGILEVKTGPIKEKNAPKVVLPSWAMNIIGLNPTSSSSSPATSSATQLSFSIDGSAEKQKRVIELDIDDDEDEVIISSNKRQSSRLASQPKEEKNSKSQKQEIDPPKEKRITATPTHGFFAKKVIKYNTLYFLFN